MLADSAGRRPIFKPVQSCLRGLEVLEAVNELRCAALPDIVRATGLPRATVIRLLETLESGGYVARDESRNTYEAAQRVGALAEGFNADGWLVTATTPVLRELLRQIQWPSDIVILRGQAMKVLNSNRPYSSLAINRNFVGLNSPVAASAVGRAYLAWSGAAERDRLIRLITNVKERASLLAELQAVRERGYGRREPGLKPAIGALAIPVRTKHGVACCLSVVYLPQVATEKEIAQRCLPAMRKAAARIAALFERRRMSLVRERG